MIKVCLLSNHWPEPLLLLMSSVTSESVSSHFSLTAVTIDGLINHLVFQVMVLSGLLIWCAGDESGKCCRDGWIVFSSSVFTSRHHQWSIMSRPLFISPKENYFNLKIVNLESYKLKTRHPEEKKKSKQDTLNWIVGRRQQHVYPCQYTGLETGTTSVYISFSNPLKFVTNHICLAGYQGWEHFNESRIVFFPKPTVSLSASLSQGFSQRHGNLFIVWTQCFTREGVSYFANLSSLYFYEINNVFVAASTGWSGLVSICFWAVIVSCPHPSLLHFTCCYVKCTKRAEKLNVQGARGSSLWWNLGEFYHQMSLVYGSISWWMFKLKLWPVVQKEAQIEQIYHY